MNHKGYKKLLYQKLRYYYKHIKYQQHQPQYQILCYNVGIKKSRVFDAGVSRILSLSTVKHYIHYNTYSQKMQVTILLQAAGKTPCRLYYAKNNTVSRR